MTIKVRALDENCRPMSRTAPTAGEDRREIFLTSVGVGVVTDLEDIWCCRRAVDESYTLQGELPLDVTCNIPITKHFLDCTWHFRFFDLFYQRSDWRRKLKHSEAEGVDLLLTLTLKSRCRVVLFTFSCTIPSFLQLTGRFGFRSPRMAMLEILGLWFMCMVA